MFDQFGNLVANAELSPPEVVYGFKGKCKMLDIPSFRPELQVPVEPMHLVTGVVTKLIELVYARGPAGASSWKTVFSNRVSDCIKKIELPTECQRTFEDLDLPRNKSQELRNFILFGFDVIARILQAYEMNDEANVFSKTAYFLRCLLMPSPWFEDLDRQVLLRVQGLAIYREFERVFGKDNCTINVHHLFAHAYDWRRRTRLHEVSAEPFESAYGEAKKRFRPGTESEGTQIIIATFIASEGGHFCKNGFVVTPYLATNKRNDSIFFDEEMRAFRCVEVANKTITCQAIATGRYQPSYIASDYKLSFAGVFAVKRWPLETDSTIEFHTSQVIAKGIKLSDNVICLATEDMVRM